MASTPFNRVRYLLGLPLDRRYGREPITNTPNTLTGGPEAIYSYRLCIAKKEGSDWLIYGERNSATTNRHMQAVYSVISAEMPVHEVTPRIINGERWHYLRDLYADRSTDLQLAAD